jgi:hypothetical protein
MPNWTAASFPDFPDALWTPELWTFKFRCCFPDVGRRKHEPLDVLKASVDGAIPISVMNIHDYRNQVLSSKDTPRSADSMVNWSMSRRPAAAPI